MRKKLESSSESVSDDTNHSSQADSAEHDEQQTQDERERRRREKQRERNRRRREKKKARKAAKKAAREQGANARPEQEQTPVVANPTASQQPTAPSRQHSLQPAASAVVTVELWQTMLLYSLARDAIVFGNDLMSDMLKVKIFGAVRQHCGVATEQICEKIIAINAGLQATKTHQRHLQCQQLEELRCLPQKLIVELRKVSWSDPNFLESSSKLFALQFFAPGTKINQDHESGIGQYDFGMIVCEMGSPMLLQMCLQAGYRDQHHTTQTSRLQLEFDRDNIALVRVLLADGRHELYDNEFLVACLRKALKDNNVKMVRIFIALEIDYLQYGDLFLYAMEDLFQEINRLSDDENIIRPRLDPHSRRTKETILTLLCQYRNSQGDGLPLTLPANLPMNVIVSAVLTQRDELLRVILQYAPAEQVQTQINEVFSSGDKCTTALAFAASFNRYEMVRMLLAAGADPNLPTDNLQQQPLAATGNQKIRILLQQHGAVPNTFYEWIDYDVVSGKAVRLRPLCAEAARGSVDSLRRVLDSQPGIDVNRTSNDVGSPLLYSLGLMLGITPLAELRSQGDERSPDQILLDCKAKFDLLIERGADINQPFVKGVDQTLFDFAIMYSAELIEWLAPHRPVMSAEFKQIFGMFLIEAARASQGLDTLSVLLQHRLIQQDAYTFTLGSAMTFGNVRCVTVMLQHLSHYDFCDKSQRFLWAALWTHFNADKSPGRKTFYTILDRVLLLTDIMPPSETAPPSSEKSEKVVNIKVYPFYYQAVKGKYDQAQQERAEIIKRLDACNKTLRISARWQRSANRFYCRVSERQFALVLQCVPDATYQAEQNCVSVIINDPEFCPRDIRRDALSPVKGTGITGRHFLMEERGLTAEEVAALRQPAAEVAVVDEQEMSLTPTWCDGEISADDGCLICLENSTPTHYLFIDRNVMLAAGCDEADLNKLLQVRRLGDRDKRCVAPLQGKLKNVVAKVQLCGKVLSVPLTGEIRDADIEARLLCGQAIECDQGGAQLFVAVLYVPSMHSEAHIESGLQRLRSVKGGSPKVIELDYEQAKASAGIDTPALTT